MIEGMTERMIERPRRLRRNALIRDLVAETRLTERCLMQPCFLHPDATRSEPIDGFTDVNRYGIDALSKKMESEVERGLRSFLLFGSVVEDLKDPGGSAAYREDSLIAESLRVLKKRFGQSVVLASDVCLCPFTDHGHCGVINSKIEDDIENDTSLEPLSKMALLHAQSGADFVAPSDMMDGRIGVIRRALDAGGMSATGIIAYTAKYASHYYGPFRAALGSAPKKLTRASYQMDFRNSDEALRELRLDIAEGADVVMVKPALAYLDIIQKVALHSDVPVAAYSVSGEYQMVKLLAESGMCNERELALENLTSIRRAGADIIISYFASECVQKGWLKYE